MTARSMAGPPPPLDSTPTRPPSGEALDRLARWCDQQAEGLAAWLAVPVTKVRPACICLDCSPSSSKWAPEHRPMFGPPRPVDRWAHLRTQQRRNRLAQAEAERARWARIRPRWRGARVTRPDALAVALDPFRPSRESNRLVWRMRQFTPGPCKLTVAQPTVAVVGKVPRPVADLDPWHPLAQAEEHPLILDAGRSCWLTNDGRVTERVTLDVDGSPVLSGGRGKTSPRPSTVPSAARKYPNPVTLPTGERVRVWAWLDRGRVQARTMSGHDVKLTSRARSTLAAWLTPTPETV